MAIFRRAKAVVDRIEIGATPRMTLRTTDRTWGVQLTQEARRLRYRAGLTVRYVRLSGQPHELVFVLATPRSGSNLLMDYLNCLPQVSFCNEVLHPTQPFGIRNRLVSKRAVLRHIRQSVKGREGRIRGAKLMLNDLVERQRISAAEFHAAFPTARYIILYRQSLAEQFVSHQLAHLTGQWFNRGASQGPRRTTRIEPAELLEYCGEIRGYYQDVLALDGIEGRAVIVTYEELTADPSQLISSTIRPFLGTDFATPQSTLRKQNTKSLSEIVENYAEVQNLLNGDVCRQQYAFEDRPVASAA